MFFCRSSFFTDIRIFHVKPDWRYFDTGNDFSLRDKEINFGLSPHLSREFNLASDLLVPRVLLTQCLTTNGSLAAPDVLACNFFSNIIMLYMKHLSEHFARCCFQWHEEGRNLKACVPTCMNVRLCECTRVRRGRGLEERVSQSFPGSDFPKEVNCTSYIELF